MPQQLIWSPHGTPSPDVVARAGLPTYSRRRRGGLGALALLVVLVVVGGVAFAIVTVNRSVQDVFDSTQEDFSSSGPLGTELRGPGSLRAAVADWNPAVPATPGPEIVGINAPRPGYTFGSVNAFVCVGATGFSLRMADGTDEPALVTQRAVPGGLGSVTQSQCRRGSIVFEYPRTGRPTAVVLNGRDNAGFANPLAPVRLEWPLPG